MLQDPAIRDFVVLYIAEGWRKSRSTVSISNSTPAVIALSARYMRRFARGSLEFRVQRHADQPEPELQAFWGRLLGVGPMSIRTARKSNSGGLRGRRWASAHGVLEIRAHDTQFRARLQGWMDYLLRSWYPGE